MAWPAQQVWHTWAVRNMESSGMGPYAVSPDVLAAPGLLKLMRDRCAFPLPRGVSASTAPGDVPTCLAFENDGGVGTVVHKQYVGPDNHGRPGNYFAHAIVDLPQS